VPRARDGESQRFTTARKTSINPECPRVVSSALEQKFIEQNLPENHALCSEHPVENTHGLNLVEITHARESFLRFPHNIRAIMAKIKLPKKPS